MPFSSSLLAFTALSLEIIIYALLRVSHSPWQPPPALRNPLHKKTGSSGESHIIYPQQRPELLTTFVQSPQICLIKQVTSYKPLLYTEESWRVQLKSEPVISSILPFL